MNEEFTYQRIVDYLRRIHILGGYGWPGNPIGSKAETFYPNIAAELKASGNWVPTMAEFANVSAEIMAATLESKEKLSDVEERSLSKHWERRGPGYLTSPKLQIIDPATNKGKRRKRELASLMEDAVNLPDPVVDKYGLKTYWRAKVKPVCDALAAGKAVTFADWWWSCRRICEVLDIEKAKETTSRTIRIS